MTLAGKVALVTGAARGIALRLAAEGADVVVNDRAENDNTAEVARLVEARGRRALVLVADVSDREAVAAMYRRAVDVFGHVDIVVANAAFSVRQPILQARWEDIMRTLEVTQFGVFHTCQGGAQQMVAQGGGGKIVIISSVHAELAVPNSAAYNMAKAAVTHFGATLAAELTAHRINVNVVLPGWIDTPGERTWSTEEELREGGKRLPWGRLGTPEDIGGVVAFLVGPDADYVTGATLRVDGGYVHGRRGPDANAV
jgi:glucose 1-dehydrogenase